MLIQVIIGLIILRLIAFFFQSPPSEKLFMLFVLGFGIFYCYIDDIYRYCLHNYHIDLADEIRYFETSLKYAFMDLIS